MADDSIMTRAEVEHEQKSLTELDSKFGGDMKVDCFVSKQSELLNTITQAVELLERTQARMHNKLLDTSLFDDVKQANDAFLARYHAGEKEETNG